MRNYILLLLTAMALFWPIQSQAYEVTPMSLNLHETGRNSMGTFRIRNTHDTPLTLELSTVRRILENGYYDITEPADDDFLLMPPQAYIEPGDFQTFRVRYMGDEQLHQSIGYRIIFRQLPVDLSHIDGDRVQFLMNVHAPVYVSPPGVRAALELSMDYNELTDLENFHTAAIDPQNESGVMIIHNRGDGVQDLSTGSFRFQFEGGDSKELSWSEISGAVYIRHILPGGESKIPLEYVNRIEGRRVTSVEFIDRS